MDLDDQLILEANARHDRNLPPEQWAGKIRSSWNETRLAKRGKLTDKKIDQYSKAGFYSAEYRQARKDLRQKKAKATRVGNYIETDGRFIYSPL